MTCPRCKTENIPGARFCKRCATPISASFIEPVAPQTNPATQLLKKHLGSPLMLILTLLLSLRLIFALLAPLASSNFYLTDVQRSALSYSFASSFVLMPIVIGAWMIYSAARNRRHYMDVKGLSVLTACNIIALVGVSIFAFVVFASAVVVFFGMLSGNVSYFVSYLAPAFRDLPENAVYALIYAAVFFGSIVIVLMLVFLAKSLKSFSFVRTVARRGKVNGHISLFIPVGSFVFAAVYIVSAACYFVMGAHLNAGCEILGAVTMTVAGVLIARLRREFCNITDPEQSSESDVESVSSVQPHVYPPVQKTTQTSVEVPVTAPESDTKPSIQANPYIRIERR